MKTKFEREKPDMPHFKQLKKVKRNKINYEFCGASWTEIWNVAWILLYLHRVEKKKKSKKKKVKPIEAYQILEQFWTNATL